MLSLLILLLIHLTFAQQQQRERFDLTINDYQTDRTCWWNEMCKEEFSLKFKCRCPTFSFCSSPGKYYNAFCTMSGTGYLWSQPGSGSSSSQDVYYPPPVFERLKPSKQKSKSGKPTKPTVRFSRLRQA